MVFPTREGYDFGKGAGFYVDATRSPGRRNYRMWTYVDRRAAGADRGANFRSTWTRQGDHRPFDGRPRRADGRAHAIPERFRSVSAFAPIVAPSQVPWGQKALAGYLGADRAAWRKHDAVALIEDGARVTEMLVDVGDGRPVPRAGTAARAARARLRAMRGSR